MIQECESKKLKCLTMKMIKILDSFKICDLDYN